MKNLIVLFIAASFILIPAGPVWAEKMDSETQNDVIGRLERILSQMETNDPSTTATTLRLADLLAERARLRFMNEVEANCQGCKGSVADRRRSIELYEGMLNRAHKAEQGIILFQLAHLYEMAGEQNKSIALFQKILKAPKGRYTKDLITRAHTGMGDIHFQKGQNKEALASYNKALKDPEVQNRGIILYRMAWCHFNMDRLAEGTNTLEKLLKNHDLLTHETTEGPKYDVSFHADVMRDLATFYSRKTITSKEIQQFNALAPKGQEKELLLYFAGEANRLGQKQAAYTIYQSYLEDKTLTKEERLDALVNLAQIKYDMGQSQQSVEDFAVAAMKYKEIKCTETDRCLDLQKRMKRYVTELHRSKKVKPTLEVLKAYFIYVKTFPEDSEMAILGAQIALDLKKDSMAVTMYHEAATASDAKIRSGDFAKLDAKTQAGTIKFRETALLGEIDAAERLKDSGLRIAAYQHYLALLPNGPKAFEVRYQMAQVAYEGKQWAVAADAFHVLANDRSGQLELRKKSADLALDCLASLKRDADIEVWAASFATLFPANADEYRQLSRKAAMNQVAVTANSDKSSNSELRAALQKMQTTDLRGASDKEKILHYRNASVLAQKAGEDALLIASLNGLLSVKTLSANEHEETLARKVGFYERNLDFASAYNVALQMKFPKSSKAEREVRLGTLADLAAKNPRPHYEAALAYGLRGSSASALRARLVLLSSTPVRELKRQKELASDRALMSETLLVVYARTKDTKGLAPFLKDPRLASTPALRFLKKQPFYADQAAFNNRLANHKLRTQSDSLLQKSIKERVRLLGDADLYLKQALRLDDYTAQVMALTTVSRENDRITRDLLTLPLPKKLTAAQQAQFSELLKQQAKPFFAKSKAAQAKLQEFWNNESAISGILKDFDIARPEVKALLAREVQILAALAPSSSLKGLMENKLHASAPTKQELLSARDAVRKNPENVSDLEKLRQLETKIGHPMMSSYIDARLGQIKRQEI